MTFAEAIYTATAERLQDPRTHVIGLGASYPGGLDGTMKDIAIRYPNQVHDTPCSEAAVTGMAVGMDINGLRPILHHGRVEFSFYAMDQILTQAAKWSYMFGGDYPVPLTARIAMGRQWGNGPQHTFTGKSVFAVPGLRVVAPSCPDSAKHLLCQAQYESNPVIFLESRWLYKTQQTISNTTLSIRESRIMRKGTDITIVAVADMVLEALKAAKLLETVGVSAEVIDLVSIYPLDYDTIHASVKKTQRLLCIDASTPAFSVAHEILAHFNGNAITCPDTPCPTSPALTKEYYPTAAGIAAHATVMLDHAKYFEETSTFAELHLPPTDNFDTLIA